MDATTLPKLTWLVQQLRADFPSLAFAESAISWWSASNATVFYCLEDHEGWELLHELAHATLGHADFATDVELLRMEVTAWQQAVDVLGPKYQCEIDESFVEEAIASYRAWLAERSACPVCGATGVQKSADTYQCLGCNDSWTANDARQCAGRRYRVN